MQPLSYSKVECSNDFFFFFYFVTLALSKYRATSSWRACGVLSKVLKLVILGEDVAAGGV